MIKKTNSGYQVLRHRRRNLRGPDPTSEMAKRRLRQVEFFKRRGR
jgi:hypothetical protein